MRDRGWYGSMVWEVFLFGELVLVKSETGEEVVFERYVGTFGLEGGRF